MTPFQVRTCEIGKTVVLEAIGKLTLTEGRTNIRDTIHVLSASGHKRFVLNLAKVETIDSYGIGELARSYSVVRQMGGGMKLAAVSERVLKALEISRLNTIFEIYPNESEAIGAFESGA